MVPQHRPWKKQPRRPSPRPPRFLAALCFGLALGACKDLSVASANLDALLDSDDHLRHVAEVRSGWRYYLESVIDPRWFGSKTLFGQSREVPVADPAYTALENLLVLEAGKGASPSQRDLVQVRQFARYALRSPGILVRERAVLELWPHARRLGLRDLSEALNKEPLKGELQNGAELSALLAGMLETFEPLLAAGDAADLTLRGDFALACEQVDENRLEIDGLWRLLKVIDTFAARADLDRELFAPLQDLSLRLQRRAVLLALAGTTIDRASRVRAANLYSQFRAFGDPVLAEALISLRGNGAQSTGPDPRFGLQAGSLQDDEPLRVLFRLLKENGWPEARGMLTTQVRENRFSDLRTLLSIVNESARFDSRTRTAAMQALQVLVPDGPETIREDAWVEWWLGWSTAEIAHLKEQQSEQGASTAP